MSDTNCLPQMDSTTAPKEESVPMDVLDPAIISKEKSSSNEELREVKKRRMPPGHVPFRRIQIPEQWKRDISAVERCVSDAFTSCTYPSLEKKERLRSAVLDVFTEARTMKESSIFYNVPFTTVQTYFHKSCKLVEEAIPSDKMNLMCSEAELSPGSRRPKLRSRLGDIVLKLTAANFESAAKENFSPAAGVTELKGSVKRKPKIVRHVVDNVGPAEDLQIDYSLPDDTTSLCFPLTAFTSDQVAMLAGLAVLDTPVAEPGNPEKNETISNGEVNVSVVPDWCREQLISYIASVSEVSEETRSRLKMAINDIYSGRMGIQDACRIHNLGYNYLVNYYDAFQMTLHKQARFILSVLSGEATDEGCCDEAISSTTDQAQVEMASTADLIKKRKHEFEKGDEDSVGGRKKFKVESEDASVGLSTLPGSSADKSIEAGKGNGGRRRKGKEKYGPPLDPSDTERIKAIEDGIVEACKPSTYGDVQRKRLHMAVSMVVRGESPVSVAASKANLPPSTIQLYAQRTRTALGTVLPPPATSLRRSLAAAELKKSTILESIAAQEKPHDSNINLKEMIPDASATGMQTNSRRSSSAGYSVEESKALVAKVIGSVENKTATSASRASLGRDRSSTDSRSCRFSQESELSGETSELAVQMLANVDFKAVLSMELKYSREELVRKIDAILRNFRYQGDHSVMRNALLDIFLDGKTIDEVCGIYKLKNQSVGAFMALTKVYCESKKQLAHRSADEETAEEKKQATVEETPIASPAMKRVSKSVEAQPPRKFKEELMQPAEGSAKSQGETSSDSGSQGITDGAVDVMVLHSDSVRCSEEACIKNIIAYLIQQQYRRSKASQEKMRICLENVLLDGLQVKEALKMVDGPSEHVLQAYISRCRDAERCITKEYSAFVTECAQAFDRIELSSLFAGETQLNSGRRSDVPSPSSKPMRKFKRGIRSSESGIGVKLEGVTYLKTILVDEVLKPLTTYLGKLNGVNFPIESSLVTGLTKVLLSHVPLQFQGDVTDESLLQWADDYRDRHPEFDH